MQIVNNVYKVHYEEDKEHKIKVFYQKILIFQMSSNINAIEREILHIKFLTKTSCKHKKKSTSSEVLFLFGMMFALAGK
jgi:hypothetical protein